MKKKTIIFYYSRTGMTQFIAKKLSIELDIPSERILREVGVGKGILGFCKLICEGIFKKKVPILPIEADLNEYDKIIIGTPFHGSKVATPVMNFVKENLLLLKQKEVSVYTTLGGPVTEEKIKKISLQLKKVMEKDIVVSSGFRSGSPLPKGHEKTFKEYKNFENFTKFVKSLRKENFDA